MSRAGSASAISPTGIVIVTHGQIGQSLIEVAEFILGTSLADVRFLTFRQSAMQETGDDELRRTIAEANQGHGVLVLTDVGGASPCNRISRIVEAGQVAMVSGLNLAMLIRVWNYRQKPLAQLVDIATEGAIRDIKGYRK